MFVKSQEESPENIAVPVQSAEAKTREKCKELIVKQDAVIKARKGLGVDVKFDIFTWSGVQEAVQEEIQLYLLRVCMTAFCVFVFSCGARSTGIWEVHL